MAANGKRMRFALFLGCNIPARLTAYESSARAVMGRLGVELADLPDLYRQADFVTIHVPGTEETRNLIRADTIAQMKDGVRVVNPFLVGPELLDATA